MILYKSDGEAEPTHYGAQGPTQQGAQGPTRQGAQGPASLGAAGAIRHMARADQGVSGTWLN